MSSARGSIQLRHLKGCEARGRDPRACRCSPAVYAVLERQWERLGHLEAGWRKSDLQPFEDRLVEMRQQLAAGLPWRPRRALRLGQWADEWFDELYAAAAAGRVAKTTYNSYESIWARHLKPAFGDIPLAAIDAAAIRRYVNAKMAGGLAPVTVNSHITPLSAMLTDAVEAGLIAMNPARQPRRARHGAGRRGSVLADVKRVDPKWLEPHEALALLNATPEPHRAMVLRHPSEPGPFNAWRSWVPVWA